MHKHYTSQDLQTLYWKISAAWQGASNEQIATHQALEDLNTILDNTSIGAPLYVQAFDLRRAIIEGSKDKDSEKLPTTATILAFPSKAVKQQ